MRNIKSENQIHSIRGASLAVRASIISLPPHPIPAVILRAHTRHQARRRLSRIDYMTQYMHSTIWWKGMEDLDDNVNKESRKSACRHYRLLLEMLFIATARVYKPASTWPNLIRHQVLIYTVLYTTNSITGPSVFKGQLHFGRLQLKGHNRDQQASMTV
jgi:hypothetical protein